MRNARIDSTQDLEGQPVVSACFDLSDEEVVAAAHAIRAMSAERYRMADLSADDVLDSSDLLLGSRRRASPLSARRWSASSRRAAPRNGCATRTASRSSICAG